MGQLLQFMVLVVNIKFCMVMLMDCWVLFCCNCGLLLQKEAIVLIR